MTFNSKLVSIISMAPAAYHLTDSSSLHKQTANSIIRYLVDDRWRCVAHQGYSTGAVHHPRQVHDGQEERCPSSPVRRNRVEQTANRVEHVTQHIDQDAFLADAANQRHAVHQFPVRQFHPVYVVCKTSRCCFYDFVRSVRDILKADARTGGLGIWFFNTRRPVCLRFFNFTPWSRIFFLKKHDV